MKKIALLLLCTPLVFVGCGSKNSKSAESQPAGQSETEQQVSESTENTEATETTETAPSTDVAWVIRIPNATIIDADGNERTEEVVVDATKDFDDLTLEKQEFFYKAFFSTNLYDKVLPFRDYIERTAKDSSKKLIYQYNPVMLAVKSYPAFLPNLYQDRPELFTFGNLIYDYNYSESPFVAAVKTGNLETVKFFYDNNIPFLDVEEDMLYGTMNRGGARFGIGGNMLIFAGSEEVRNYLVEKGFPTEEPAPQSFTYTLRKDEVSVKGAPRLDSKPVATITKEDSFTPVTVLTYEVDNLKWMKIKTNTAEGWINTEDFHYDMGI